MKKVFNNPTVQLGVAIAVGLSVPFALQALCRKLIEMERDQLEGRER